MAVHPIGEGRQAARNGGRLLHWIVLDAVPSWEEAARKSDVQKQTGLYPRLWTSNCQHSVVSHF